MEKLELQNTGNKNNKSTLLFLALLVVVGGMIPALAQTDMPRTIGKVLLIDSEKTVEMKYSIVRRRGTSSALRGVFATDKEYLVLDGAQASLRTRNAFPIFDFFADVALNVDDSIYLVQFDRESDRRQVRIGIAQGGKVRTGVPKERKPKALLETVGEGPNSTTHYRLKPSIALSPGEYCLVRSGESCFDFGIDPQ